MKIPILLIIACFFVANLSGQNKKKTFADCGSTRNAEVYKGDTVIILCDSLIILTKKKFKLYQSNNRTYTEIVSTYDGYVDILEKRSVQQTREYNQLKLLNDSLVRMSGLYTDSIDWKVGDLKSGISRSLHDLQTIRTDVSSLKTDVQKSGRLGKLKSKFLWGGGGVIIGIIAGILLN